MLKPRPIRPVGSPHDSVDTSHEESISGTANQIKKSYEQDKAEDSDDTDAEPQKINLTGPNEASYRKRTCQENFNALAEKKRTEIATSDKKAAMKAMSDYKLSTSNLIRKQEYAANITTPREYQIELFERAKTQNTIAVLDTGSGKTLIAVLLLQHVIDEELARRGTGMPPRISFFLVDSVTLVFQQYAVLDNNIDQNIGHFCGAMGTDLWSKDVWVKHIEKNMVIVCTAEVLRGCLLHAYITMDQINLLIFDEAHHAKKNHPYAKIIEDFYNREGDKHRPRIFGMTASPVDAKVNVAKAAIELESLLDSKIATTSDLSLLRKSISRPNEIDWVYDKDPGFLTPLYYKIEAQFGNMKFLQGLFKSAKHAAENLGPWASDRVWEHGLREEESDKIERKAERSLLGSSAQVPTGMNGHADQAKGQTQESMGWIDTQLKRIRMAQALVAGFPFEQLQPNPQHLNQKVLRLHTELCRYFERKTNTKCIVFVERRHTARILCDIFREIGTPFLKPGALLGVRKAGDMNVSYRNQVLTLIDFRNGNLNCLFATSIAEEGLDIPDCNLIIRFDLYNTVIQYIQSRGRARHLDSTFVHMIESGNENQRELRGAVHDTERILQAFCQSLPEDRCLDRDGRNTSRMSHRGLYDQTLQIPETGATLTSNSSLAVLAHFAACLNSDQASNSQLNYAIRCQDRMFQAEVFLPDNTLCSIKSAIGIPTPSKAKAKQSAALNACRELIKARLFDKHLNPTFQKLVHSMHGARLAIKGKKTNKYKMLVKPRIWENTWGEVLIPTTGEVPVPTTVIPLYMVVIELRPKAPLSKPHHPIAFLTRTRMPTFPTFPVYLDNDVETAVVSTPVSSPLRLDGSLMAKLVAFTFRIYEDCFNKRYIRDPSKMSYWLAPVEHDWQDLSSKDAISIIDQSVLNLITTDEPILYPKPDEHAVDSLVNKFLLDPNSGQYRYFPIGVEHSLSGDSPIPAHIMPRRKAKTIMEYSLTLWGGARDKFLLAVDKRQPVLKVKLAPIRRNLLDKVSMAEKNVLAEYYVCPRALKVSELPISIAVTAFVFPAILSRFESYMIAQEACDHLGLRIPPDLALEAVTKDSDNTSEHRGEQIQYQRGMGKNYERLEFLGDCFLKMAVSIAVFVNRPGLTENWYHNYRMVLICNRNLFMTAVERELCQFIRSQSFERSAWYPEGLTLDGGRKLEPTTTHALAEKTIADVCEALIGAAILSYEGSPAPNDGVQSPCSRHDQPDRPDGQHQPQLSSIHNKEEYDRGGKFDMAVKAVTVRVNNKENEQESVHTNITCWGDYYQHYTLPEYQVAPSSHAQLDLAKQIQEKLGYRFNYPRLLRSAFVHPSYGYMMEKIPNYQLLEFLGDSLLDMVCVGFLYHRYPDKDPQWLTEHKMAMVSNKFFGAVAIKLGFHRHLKHSTNMLIPQITEYALEIQQAQESAAGVMDYWMVTKDPPKCLPDTLEAYVGALFVDSKFDYREVERFFQLHIQPYFEDMSLYDTFANKHPTIQLEKLMVEHLGCREWTALVTTLESIDGTEPQNFSAVMIHSKVVADGTATSLRNAKVRACANAVAKLESMPLFRFREEYGCDCKPEDADPDCLGDPKSAQGKWKGTAERIEDRRDSLVSMAANCTKT